MKSEKCHDYPVISFSRGIICHYYPTILPLLSHDHRMEIPSIFPMEIHHEIWSQEEDSASQAPNDRRSEGNGLNEA